ncbi:universal stress protein [Haloarcula brevis]|uniref:universal stress protein n=1 Tax=Haloarcula brevis TaxID=3111453 RepID=UPI00300EF0AE
MVLLVPFDGSALSEAALERATEFADYRDEEVTVLSVIPDDAAYARERGWVDADEAFSVETVADRMREQAEAIAPTATFRYETPEDVSSMASTTTDVSRTIREVAHDTRASIVFIGSENAGRVSSPVYSVGSPVSEDPQYDVHIVRHA